MQEKNITPPTDSKLYYKAIVKLGNAAKRRGLRLRQTYLRVAKHAAIKAGRYAHAKQFRRMRRQLRFLPCFGGIDVSQSGGRDFAKCCGNHSRRQLT